MSASDSMPAVQAAPFAEREYIDMPRCCRILGVNETVTRRLAESGLIKLIDHLPRTRKKIRYQSVVDLCDRLRKEYGIPDARPRLSAAYLRHRDADLLPFPLTDTICSNEAMELIGCGFYTLTRLIDEGRILAYRLAPGARTPWRISRSSVTAHMQRTLNGVVGGAHRYTVIEQ
jgi:excisionase family DNA binding protein